MIRSVLILGILVLLSGCYFDYPLTGVAQKIDPTLSGKWRDSTEEITVEVRSLADEYRIRYSDNDGTYLFDNAVILKVDGHNFLQARFLGEENPDGTIGDAPKGRSWLVLAFEKKGDKVIMRIPDTDEKFVPRELKSAQDYRSAFVSAIHRDGFFGPPMIFRKITP